jgi:uncharacterized membrane protein (DUF106 family)
MAEQSTGGAKPPQKSQMMYMMITLAIMMGVMFFYEKIGRGMDPFMYPVFGFGGERVVLTLAVAAATMMGISTIIRTLLTDTVTQAKNQKEMSAFNAELRKARMENNLYKIKKLTEQQPEMMSKSMESSMKMMKTMPLTMLIVIPVFAWLRYFLGALAVEKGGVVIAAPWNPAMVIFEQSGGTWQSWILIYMLITIPLAQIIGRIIRWYMFKKRLEKLDGTAA